MKELVYKVTFLSDIVLPATSNSEGNIEQLDFIPGSNFLGMVAREYAKFTNPFDVFHSSKVRFGDATLLDSGKLTYKVPLSYFHEKLDDSVVYNHHHIKDFSEFKQLKQMRKGYITKDNSLSFVEYNYTQKSSYDKKNRRSKDSGMYGYKSIESGSTWQFSIKYDESIDSEDLERIKSNIVGKKRLGKSKTSQYGEVLITEEGTNENIQDSSLSSEVVLYVNSRLALHKTDSSHPTLNLIYLTEGLKDENIVWSKCQLRTSSFTPYNGARATKDYERVVINKGSIIVLKDITSQQLQNIQKGVGSFLSEGFGEVLVNPSFLKEEEGFSLTKKESDKGAIAKELITDTFEDTTVQFLANRHNKKIDRIELSSSVQKFIDKNKNIYNQSMNSQWGTIRSLCSSSTEENIASKTKAYISKGVAKDKWDGEKSSRLMKAIENSKNSKEFIKMLAMQMPKETSNV